MKFCINCGKEMGGELFCVQCGTKAPDYMEVTKNVESSGSCIGKSAGRNSNVIIVCVLIVVAAALSLVLSIRGVNSTVKQYADAMYKTGKVENLIKLVPNKIADMEIAEESMSRYGYIKEFNDDLKSGIDLYKEKYGRNYKVKKEITGKENISGDRLRELKESCRQKYGINISKAMTAYVDVTVSGNGDKETKSVKLNLIKVGFRWYLAGIDD